MNGSAPHDRRQRGAKGLLVRGGTLLLAVIVGGCAGDDRRKAVAASAATIYEAAAAIEQGAAPARPLNAIKANATAIAAAQGYQYPPLITVHPSPGVE